MHFEERSKLQALSENPMVALTIDTEVHPPKILLIRGRAELDFVDGIPDEYLQATSTYEMTPEQRVEWEAGVRSHYHDGMVRIVVTPNWAKLRGKQPKLTTRQQRELVRMHDTGEYSIAELGELFTVSRATVYRVLERHRITNAAAGQPTAP
jgi:Helix-turn-helix domain of resolvase